MAVNLEQFVKSLYQLGLVQPHEVGDLYKQLSLGDRPMNAEQLARKLMELGKLTRFQASCLLTGNAARLSVGPYLLLDTIGSGGSSRVFKARQFGDDKIVALKVLLPSATESSDIVNRFYREFQTSLRLEHANIVKVFDAGEVDGVHFLAMEFVVGEDLGSRVTKRGPFPIPEGLDYMIQAATGLGYAHSRGLVHRDVKPSNLMRDAAGLIRILDLGLARIRDALALRTVDGDDTKLTSGSTESGLLMGSADYVSPEQARRPKGVDGRADIYSLGCTLHYVLTGYPPYSGHGFMDKVFAHRDNPVPSLRDRQPDMPPLLDAIFQRMLAKNPDDRQATMEQVVAELSACT